MLHLSEYFHDNLNIRFQSKFVHHSEMTLEYLYRATGCVNSAPDISGICLAREWIDLIYHHIRQTQAAIRNHIYGNLPEPVIPEFLDSWDYNDYIDRLDEAVKLIAVRWQCVTALDRQNPYHDDQPETGTSEHDAAVRAAQAGFNFAAQRLHHAITANR